MTTKELLTRLSFYSDLDSAAILFNSASIEKCFQIRVLSSNGRSFFYCSDLSDFPSLIKGLDVISVTIDIFSRSVFNAQVKYFKSFFNRASMTQRDYVKRSLLVNNLLKFIDDSGSK